MGSKIIAIFLLVIGLGIGLYVVNSGLSAKIGALTHPTPTATTTVAGQTVSSTVATSSNPFLNFLSQLFHPGTKNTGPTAGGNPSGGSGGTGTTGGTGVPGGNGLPSVTLIPTSTI